MKKALALLFLLLTLTGCSLAPKEYLYQAPHVDSSTQSGASDAVTVENYLSMKNAILNLVKTGQTEGVIHAANYDGVVEDDLAEAAYEVSKLDPLGAYAVDYMTHSCAQIVSYYEIRINITFRRTAQEVAEIISVSTMAQLEEKLQAAIDNADSRLTLRLSSYRDQDQDIPTFVADHCAAHPDTVMEIPSVTTSVYPESGSVRILEITFGYKNPPETLQEMQRAVQESLHGGAEYIRYRETDWDKAQLLFTYLQERFQYAPGETTAPLYDALCGGVADPTGLSQAWTLICDRAGVECRTVSGMRDGEAYTWNIFQVDGFYRHLDLSRCLLELGTLTLWTDEEMTGYYWNDKELPACEPIPEAETPADAEPETEAPEEELPEEPLPPLIAPDELPDAEESEEDAA